ncbi:MAG: hypothetical protein AB4063_19750 [Crocosphaera sp.]
MTALINRYQPTTIETKLYTLSRTCRILKCKKDNIEFIYPTATGVIVGFWTYTKFIEKAKFTALLAGERKNRSKGLIVTENAFDDGTFTVRNESKNTSYIVKQNLDSLPCTCQDFENLSNDFGTNQVLCKHGYAVLNSLGFGTLRDYLQFTQDEQQRLEKEEYKTLQYSNY